MIIQIVYPEHRIMDDEEIAQWYADAFGAGMIRGPHTDDPLKQAKALQGAGLIAYTKPSPVGYRLTEGDLK